MSKSRSVSVCLRAAWEKRSRMSKHNAELREISTPELQTRLAGARQELFNLRIQQANHQLANSQRLGEVRREIARLLTLLRERELAEAS